MPLHPALFFPHFHSIPFKTPLQDCLYHDRVLTQNLSLTRSRIFPHELANLPMLRPLYVHVRGMLPGRLGLEYANPPSVVAGSHGDQHEHQHARRFQHNRNHQGRRPQEQQRRRRIPAPWSLKLTWSSLRTGITEKLTSISSGTRSLPFTSKQRSRVETVPGTVRDARQNELDVADGEHVPGIADYVVTLGRVDSARRLSDDLEVARTHSSSVVPGVEPIHGRGKS